MVGYLDNSQDRRILRLGFMLLDNVMRSAFLSIQRRERVMSEAVRDCLNQVLTRCSQEEGVTEPLRRICERVYHIVNLPIQPARIPRERHSSEEVEQ